VAKLENVSVTSTQTEKSFLSPMQCKTCKLDFIVTQMSVEAIKKYFEQKMALTGVDFNLD
jgi:hypothetical protein